MDFSALMALQMAPSANAMTQSKSATSSATSTPVSGSNKGDTKASTFAEQMNQSLHLNGIEKNAEVKTNAENIDSPVLDEVVFQNLLNELQNLLLNLDEQISLLSEVQGLENTTIVEQELEQLFLQLNTLVSQIMSYFQENSGSALQLENMESAIFHFSNEKFQRFLDTLSKTQINDLTKMMNQLQQILLKQENLSAVDSKVLHLLAKITEYKNNGQLLNTSLLNSQTVITDAKTPVNSSAGESKPVVSPTVHSMSVGAQSQNSKEGETEQSQKQTSSKQQPFLLRTDTSKVVWQSEMPKVQQLTLRVDTNGNQVNTESFMKNFEKLLASSNFMKNGMFNKLVIKLHPETLGTIRVELIQSQTSLVAKLHVQNEQVRSLIESHLSGLKNSFAAQNIQVDKFEISSNLDFEKFQKQAGRDFLGNSDQSKKQNDQSQDMRESEDEAQVITFKDYMENIKEFVEEVKL